jgi:prepilin-type N-terminal cleavage/methylation domain-containing protein
MNSTYSARRSNGVTLVELLVAMILVATLTAGGLSAFARANTTWRVQQTDQRRYERAQYVFGTIEPELQMAGYFGRTRPQPLPAGSVPPSVRMCGPDFIAQLERPAQRIDAVPTGCVARSVWVAGSDALLIRRVSTQAAAPRAGRGQWLTSADPSAPGVLLWNGQLPPDLSDPELRDLIVRFYYIARRADGDPNTPALRVKTLTEVAGAPAWVDTEVMPGVESLKVELLPETAPRSARITLRVRADAADSSAQDSRRTLSVTRHFTLRNTAPAAS